MELKTKKIIAREFILFLTCILISVLAYFIVYCYNYYNKSSRYKYQQETIIKIREIDSLDKKFNRKNLIQNKFTNSLNSLGYDYPNLAFWNKLYHYAKTDSIAIKWNTTWPSEFIEFIKKSGYITPAEFQSFILKNIVNKTDLALEHKRDSIKLELPLLYKKERQYYIKILNNSDILLTALLTFVITLTLVFIVRPLYFAIKWSINILSKQAE